MTDTDEVIRLKKRIETLESEKSVYENGSAKLYYALQRKMAEMSKALNMYSLDSIDLMSKADATFERVFKLLEKSEVISNAAAGLGAIAGVTGNEEKDTGSYKRITTPESIADHVGELAGKNHN